MCIDAGDLNRAYDWYQKGHDTGLNEPNLAQSRRDLWSFRLAHAKARIAAKRAKGEEAQKYVREARAILDKGTNAEQEQYFPYLSGYVAFYAGDYAAALAALQTGDIADPFIQCLTGQTMRLSATRTKHLNITAAPPIRPLTACLRLTPARSHSESFRRELFPDNRNL